MKQRTPKSQQMNKTLVAITGIFVVGVLWFQQMEIQSVHDDVQEIKQFIIKGNEKMKYTAADVDCLAKNIYHEAGVESRQGKFAVAQVTINRLRDGRWGKTICKVVYAKAQFSWTLYAKKRSEAPKGQLWTDSHAVAVAVLEKGYRVPSLQDSILYHADYIKPPTWVKSVVKIQQIGQHIFYKLA
jgi:spore germination cell wall hydrolase CwlJ-like protein